MSKLKPTQNCCEVWPRIMGHFEWMQFTKQPSLYGLAYLPDMETKDKWRINFCPSCGKEIRGFIADKVEVLESRYGKDV